MSYTPILEAWLYPLGDFASVDIAATATPGPSDWVTYAVPGPMTVTDLVAWIGTQAGGFGYVEPSYDPPRISFLILGARSLRFGRSLADALGFSALEHSRTSPGLVSSDMQAKALWSPFGIDVEAPRAIEHVDLREYSWGRVSAYHSRQGRAVRMSYVIDTAVADAFIDSGTGTHGKVRVYPYSVSGALSYSAATAEDKAVYLDVYPFEIGEIDRPGRHDAAVIITVEAMLETVTPPTVDPATMIAQLAMGLRYGFGLCFAAKMEGIPLIACEHVGDAPTEPWAVEQYADLLGASSQYGHAAGALSGIEDASEAGGVWCVMSCEGAIDSGTAYGCYFDTLEAAPAGTFPYSRTINCYRNNVSTGIYAELWPDVSGARLVNATASTAAGRMMLLHGYQQTAPKAKAVRVLADGAQVASQVTTHAFTLSRQRSVYIGRTSTGAYEADLPWRWMGWFTRQPTLTELSRMDAGEDPRRVMVGHVFRLWNASSRYRSKTGTTWFLRDLSGRSDAAAYPMRIYGEPSFADSAWQTYAGLAPDGYEIERSLVIDGSARLGSQVEREEGGIGAAFDLTMRLLDTAAVRDLFTSPSKATWLTEDLAFDDTVMHVPSGRDYTGGGPGTSGVVHVGVEGIPWSGFGETTVRNLQRGVYGPAREHEAGQGGALVSDRPLDWRGRRVQLYLYAVDPYGRIVTSDGGIFTDAAESWSGYMGSEGYPSPRRVGAEWEIGCRSRDRRLQDAIGHTVTGKARWAVDRDPLIWVYPSDTLFFKVRELGGSVLEAGISITPFAATAGKITASRARALISAAWDAARTHVQLGRIVWKEEIDNRYGATIIVYRAYLEARYRAGSGVTRGQVEVTCTKSAANITLDEPTARAGGVPALPTIEWGEIELPLYMRARGSDVLLEVRLDKGSPADLPPTGWVRLEGDDNKRQTIKYDAITVLDGADGPTVAVHAETGVPDPSALIAAEIEDEIEEVTASFVWGDTGRVADLMRRLLQSSGRGDNGPFDVLPLEQGYDIAEIDVASFDEVLDGHFAALTADLAIDERASFADLFGGLLILGERAIVMRPTATGTLALTAVRVGAPTAVTRFTSPITDADLVIVSDGIKPVRELHSRPAPNRIEVDVKLGAGDNGKPIVANDKHRQKYQAITPWRVDVYGVPRATLLGPLESWALGQFRQSQTIQAIEIDVGPWVDAEPGDEVPIDLRDVQLWDYASGTPGYTGPGRCLAARMGPKNKVKTLVALIGGGLLSTVLSPSAPIVGYAGSRTAPTSLEVPAEYFDVFDLYRNQTGAPLPFVLRMYEPGADDAGLDVEIDDVTDGPTVTLSVSSWPTGVDVESVIYAEDFEVDAGDWVVKAPRIGGSAGIQRKTGSTSSTGTGPTAAYAGSWYTYFESSSPAAYLDREEAEGPSFSLLGFGAASMHFARHMYGSAMGTLAMRLSTDRGATWKTVWKLSGNQGNSWAEVAVDLEDYVGLPDVRWLIRCDMPAAGTAYLSDMAWDALEVRGIRWHLTNPPTGASGAQDAHLHTDAKTIWS